MSNLPVLPLRTFDNLKGIGNLSGVARKFMLMDATIKASENMETFGPVVQRCVSVVLAGICNITNIKYRPQLVNNLIDVEFGSILPEDLACKRFLLPMVVSRSTPNARLRLILL